MVAAPGPRPWRLAACLGASALLAIALTLFLLFAPTKTPFISVAVTDYGWPFPVNASGSKDARSLTQLDGQTLAITDVSPAWRYRERALAELEKRLTELPEAYSRTRSIVIYLNLHGIVDGTGTPYLITPDAVPHDPATWVPVREVLNVIARAVPARWNKLLLFDCSRSSSNWNLGVVYNSFPERLEQVIREANVPHLVAINSSSPGQISWESPTLTGSVFGHYLHLGIAGDADNGSGAGRGNGDGRVSVQELLRYLQQHVNAWTVANRGELQQPQLIPATTDNFHVAWCLNRRALQRLKDKAQGAALRASPIGGSEWSTLLNSLERLREKHVTRLDPLAWRDLEHKLLHLESWAAGGDEYQTPVRESLTALHADVRRLTDAWNAPAASSLPGQWNPLRDPPPLIADGIPTHTLPLAEYFGRIPPAVAEQVRNVLTTVAASAGTQSLQNHLAAISAETPLDTVVEVQFLRLAEQADAYRIWPNAQLVADGLRLRQAAENLAVPRASDGSAGDERAHELIRRSILSADEQRRDAEDTLWIGEANAPADPAQLITAAEGAYRDVADQLQRATEVFQLRDRIWSELPYLAQWLDRTTRVRGATTENAADLAQLDSTLLQLIEQAKQLDQSLFPQSGDADPPPDSLTAISARAEQVQEGYSQLRGHYDQQVEELLDETLDDVNSLRDIQSVLATPLTLGEKRIALHRQFQRIAAQLHEKFQSESPAGSGASSARARTAEQNQDRTTADVATTLDSGTYRRRVAQWRPHPALALTTDAGDADSTQAAMPVRDDLDALEQQGDRLRGILRNIAARERVGSEMAVSGSERFRALVAAEEHRLRRAAALWFQRPKLDAVQHLRIVDLQRLLLWHCERVLEDGWGPIGARGPQQNDADSYFEHVVHNYLAAVPQLQPPSQAIADQIAAIERRTVGQSLAAQQGVQRIADAQPRGSEAEALSIQGRFAAAFATPVLPRSRAALFLRDSRGTRIEVQPKSGTPAVSPGFLSFPLPPEKPQEVELTVDPAAQLDANMQLVALLRGHEFTAPFVVEGLSGITIEHQPHRYGQPRITLRGQDRQRASIVLILDCSASMKDPIRGESLGSAEMPKLDVAKSVLASMLTELAARGNARVGVRFFGHRLGWSTSSPTRILTQEKYLGDVPPDRTPGTDIETVLTLGRFDSIEAGKVLDRLSTVVPWGQSPLYLAILEALGDFANEGPETHHSIVVITDGANYQFTPATGDSREAAPTTIADLQRALGQRSVPVHILGFGMAAQEAATSAAEFRAIAERTSGSYRPVTNGKDLLAVLRERLGVAGYVVRTAREGEVSPPANQLESRTASLNTSVLISPPPTAPTECVVEFGSIRGSVILEGGEWLDLQLVDGGRRMQAVPFDTGFSTSAQLTHGSRGTRVGHMVRAHRPVRREKIVRFPISVQATDTLYTKRPAEIWVEITPDLPAEQQPPTYTFYDANYEPEQPVPVLYCEAPSWPENAKRALIRVWCHPERTPAIKTIPFTEVISSPGAFAEPTPLPTLSHVKFRLSVNGPATPADDAYELNVMEIHDDGSAEINAVQVQFDTGATIRPRRVTHRFDAQNGIVSHSFVFARDDWELLKSSDSSQIRFTSRQAIQDRAWQIEGDQSLIVEVITNSDVISLEPAVGIP